MVYECLGEFHSYMVVVTTDVGTVNAYVPSCTVGWTVTTGHDLTDVAANAGRMAQAFGVGALVFLPVFGVCYGLRLLLRLAR